MNDFMVTHLDSIDEDLLGYLDEDEELSIVVVRRDYTVALLDDSIAPAALDEDWSDRFLLVRAYIVYMNDAPKLVLLVSVRQEYCPSDTLCVDDNATPVTDGSLSYAVAACYSDCYPEQVTTGFAPISAISKAVVAPPVRVP